jgi:hypothetical protein
MPWAGHGQAMGKRCVQSRSWAGHGQEVGVEQVMGKSWARDGCKAGVWVSRSGHATAVT